MALTDRDTQVKEFLWGNEPTKGDPYDDLLDDLILRATSRIESMLGYAVEDSARTDYLDGTDTPYLFLPSGPLVTLTQVDCVSHGESDTETTLDAWRYVLHGQASTGHKGRGWITRIDGSTFATGSNVQWKVQHTSGFAAVPADIEGLATWLVASEFQGREAAGLLSKSVGDTTVNILSPERFDEHIKRVLGPYLSEAL